MPKKSTTSDPVLLFVNASQAFATAKANLHEAIRKDELSPEGKAVYELLREGLTPKRNGRSKPEKDSVVPAASFQPVNENGPTSSN